MSASIVLCTRDRPALAAAAVESILAGRAIPSEIVVVDQSRQPDSAIERLATTGGPLVRHVPTPTSGLSRARNLGAGVATSEVLAFCDDDVVAEADWLDRLVDALLQAGRQSVATGRVVPGPPEVADGFVPATVLGTTPAVFRGRLDHRDVLAGGNMAIFRSTFWAVGGFDERLGAGSKHPSAEDNDLGLRLLESGYAIVYEPSAVLVHRAWRPSREYPGLRWRYGLGKGGFYAKHARLDGSYGLRRGARDIARRFTRAPVAVWRHPRYAAGELTYAAGVVVGALTWSRRWR